MRLRILTGWVAAFVWCGGIAAQVITSIAGNVAVSDGQAARQIPLVFCRAVVADADGATIYIADDGSATVRRIDRAAGIATVLAGGGLVLDDLIPVPGRSAYLDRPVGLALGPGRNLYIADDANNRVRLLTPDGLVTTIAGNGTRGFSGDGGQAVNAQLFLPSGVALDSTGNLYITDRGNSAIRKVNLGTGVISTIAGGPQANRTGEGIPAREAKLNAPAGIAVDAAGNVLFADRGDHVVRKIEAATGLIRTVAGSGVAGSAGDNGPATAAQLNEPWGVAAAPNGDLYLGQLGRVRRIAAATGIITTVLGGGSSVLQEGRRGAELFIPDGTSQLFVTSQNLLLVALHGDNLIGSVDLNTGIFGIVAGNPLAVGDGGPAASASVAQPQKLALDGSGNLYIVDEFHHRVRRVLPGSGGLGTGAITTVAGTGAAGVAHEGSSATDTALWFPEAVAVDFSNRVYFTEVLSRVLRIESDGRIRTVAGGTTGGFSGDGGPATQARLNFPKAIALDSAGNMYIADTLNHRVRRVDTGGIIRTIAGTGDAGFFGDGGLATMAQLNQPWDLLLDGVGGLLIADRANHRIRRLDLSTGIITTFAGNGSGVHSGDGGPALAAGLRLPRGLARDSQGNVYVAEVNAVRRIDAGSRVITTVVGGPDPGFRGDGGLATLARLNGVEGIVVDREGNLIFSDTVNSRIRRVSAARLAPALAVSPTALSFQAIEGGAPPGEQALRISTTNLVGASWTASAQVESGFGWLNLRPASGVTPGVLLVGVSSSGLAAGTYRGSITVSSTGAQNSPQVISVTLVLRPRQDPQLALDRRFVSFRATQGGTDPAPQALELTNASGGLLEWSSTVETSGGGDWLAISPGSGTGAATLALSVRVGSLTEGVYQGLVLLQNSTTGQVLPIVVSFIISRPVSALALSHTGALFRINEGATFIPSDTVHVLNVGQGEMSWQTQVFPLSGGEWLTVPTPSGSSPSSGGRALTLSANPAGLRAGVYDALLTVSAPGATDSPQLLLARLHVQPANAPPVARIQPGGLALVGVAGGRPTQDSFSISTTGGPPLSFVASASTADGGAWLSVSPPGGSLLGSAEKATLTVQANPAQLSGAGLYRGKVTIALSTGVTQDVAVLLILTAPAAPAAAAHPQAIGEELQHGSTCIPTQQYPYHTSLLNNFSLPLRWPTPILVRVVDNCGNAVSNSSVISTFSNGDEAIVLRPAGNGVYNGLWNSNRSGTVTVSVHARGSNLEPGRAEAIAGGIASLGAGSETPLIFPHGAVHAASYQKFAPLARGQIFSLFGEHLSRQRGSADRVPLPRSLAGVSVRLGGAELPLYYAGEGQVNAQVPFELPPGETFPLVVTSEGKASPPELVTLTDTQPGVFSLDASGSGAGVITNAQGALIAPSNPARRGEVVVIYATGLGATNPPVRSGEASPSSPVATAVDPVRVYIGGIPVQPEFAGLTPGLVALYQVNVRIPENAPLGDAIELYLEQRQIASNKVTLAIR